MSKTNSSLNNSGRMRSGRTSLSSCRTKYAERNITALMYAKTKTFLLVYKHCIPRLYALVHTVSVVICRNCLCTIYLQHRHLPRIQRRQNTAVRIITLATKYNAISPLRLRMKNLQAPSPCDSTCNTINNLFAMPPQALQGTISKGLTKHPTEPQHKHDKCTAAHHVYRIPAGHI